MEAYNTGYEAARHGEPLSDKPYPEGSWDSEQWDEGWADAMEWYSFFGASTIHKFELAGLGKAPFEFTGEVTEETGSSSAERKLRDVKNAAAKQRKKSKKESRIASATEKLPTVCGKLASQPHPNSHFAAQGRTLLDYVNWCLENHAEEKACEVIENS